MDAIITGESERVGLSVIDNNDIEHLIEMDESGEIKYHEQDGYPDDPSDRTETGNEHVNQARRYAKYYVFQERGYETMDPYRNPSRVFCVGLAVASMDTNSVERYFGDLYRQVRSHYTTDEPAVSLPDDVGAANVTYKKDVYLGLPIDIINTLGNIHTDDEFQNELKALHDRDRTFTPYEIADGIDIDLSKLGTEWIQAVSGVHVHWDDAAGRYHTEWTANPDIDRDPEGRLDLLPFEPETVDSFQAHLTRVLWCQVRDCYLGMGVRPPKAFRVQGLGSYSHATWYDSYELYQPYHDPDADICWEESGDQITV